MRTFYDSPITAVRLSDGGKVGSRHCPSCKQMTYYIGNVEKGGIIFKCTHCGYTEREGETKSKD